jgi:hypothetical protein
LDLGWAEISSKVMFNDAALKKKGNGTRNNKMRHREQTNQFYCEVDDAHDLRRWRKEARIFELAVRRMINRLHFSMYRVTDPLCRSTTNSLAITEIELKL